MTAPARYDVVIVGAGHGGAQVAAALRQAGFTGSIGLLGDDPELPYERPPLSKDYLSGEASFDRMLIRPASFWPDRDITLLGGRLVTGIDPEAHRLRCADGAEVGYGRLIWAAGGVARTIACPGHDLPGVHVLRSRADSDRVRAGLVAASRVVVIGGGYIGLEAAAVITQAGKQVTVIEAQDRVLARVAGEPLSRFYEKEHRTHGVSIRLGTTVERIEGHGSQVSGVRLAGYDVMPCDLVIVGIGIVPAVGPLLAAGATGADGVEVDSQCRTSLPDVFAVGDCAAHRNRYADGALVRLESVQNATDQASVVAQVITGNEASYQAVPWFWSKQYDLRLQTVGLSGGHDETVLRGDPASRRFSVVYLRRGRVVALDCVNNPKDYVQGKRLVTEGTRADRALLADSQTPLKAL